VIRIRRELFNSLEAGGPEAVIGGLEDALRLEFSTIPLYLYALWSLDRTKNRTIAQIVRSVVIEEMLHMTLVCNILNALGRAPEIDDPKFVPSYPGPLPGGVESELTVHLQPFSTEQLGVFLQIEEPETVLNFPDHAVAAAVPPLTIGRFYMALRQQIGLLKNSDFASAGRNQIDSTFIDNAAPVTDVGSAQAAVDLIVLQGEGSPLSPLEAPNGAPAHYYRLNQIAKHAALRPNPAAGPNTPADQRYIYDGASVTFDATGVSAAPFDPKAANYPDGSAARKAMDAFNREYRDLLNSLQRGFNGESDELNAAISPKMGALGLSGRKLMTTVPIDGGPLGPSFEWVP
jgi:Ferritin-like